MREAAFVGRLIAIAASIMALMFAWHSLPLIQAWLFEVGELRLVTPRGELAADEIAIIELFEARRDSVVSMPPPSG